MTTRSWRWLRTRILGLLDRPSQVVAYTSGDVSKIALIPSTRLGYALNPPVFE